MNVDGTNRTNLTRNSSPDYGPAWSPDGTRIAFASNRDGTWRIYVMDGDGSDPRPLTAGPWDRDPTWSPDGSQILFLRSLDTGGYVYAVPAGGGADRSLARSNIEIRASWSPDGTAIAFTSALDRPFRINTINPDGSDRRTVQTVGDAFALDWSPDGRKLVFASLRFGTADLFTSNRDGSGETRITSSADNETRPSWSPDGTKIAYVTFGGVIKVVGIDGSGELTLTDSATSFLGTPDWQPATDVTVRAGGPVRGTVGRGVTYSVRVANVSPRAARSVSVQLSLSGPATVVARATSRGSCAGTSVLTCELGDLGPQGDARLTVTVRPRRTGTMVLRVTARSATPEATEADNRASRRTTVRRKR